MRPLGWLGVVLIVLGCIVLVMRGVSYTKDRQEVNVGPISVAAEEKGFVPPAVGFVAIALGVGMVVMGRRKA
jgi:hypothetical protein